jgi:hypothetical protein
MSFMPGTEIEPHVGLTPERHMGGGDDHAARVELPRHDAHEAGKRGGVESHRRLVQQPQHARHQHEAGQRQPPLLPGGEQARGIGGKPRQVEGLQRLLHVAAAQEVAPEGQVLVNAQGRLHRLLMRDVMRLLADREVLRTAGELMSPAVASFSPATSLRRDDLPEPFGPVSCISCPGRSASERPRNTIRPPRSQVSSFAFSSMTLVA